MTDRRFIISRLALTACLSLLPSLTAQDEADGLETFVVAELKDMPYQRLHRGLDRLLTELPEGGRLRVQVGQYFDQGQDSSTNKMEPYIYSTVPVDEKSLPNGTEQVHDGPNHGVGRTVTWVHGKKHGPEQIRRYDGNWYIAKEIPWENDAIVGKQRAFLPNGKRQSETDYQSGQADGNSISYDADGKLSRKCTMVKGQRHGVLTDYWPLADQPKRAIPYKNGKVDGVAKEYFASGKLKRERTFRDDALHGVEKEYDDTGKVVRTRVWKENELVSEQQP